MPNAQTIKVLEDLERGGINVSSIRTQISSDPIADKKANEVFDGILRLPDYTKFVGEYKEKEKRLQAQVAELASRQGAIGYLTKDSVAYKEMEEHIDSLEKALVEADIFDEDSVKNVHSLSQERLNKLVTDSANNPPPPPAKKEGEDDMPANFDPNKFIDVDTHKTSMANLAMGTITMTAKINRQLDQARALGVDITPELEKKLDENLMSGLTAGKDVGQIFDETFGLSKIRSDKAEESRQAELKAAEEKGYAQAKKEDGVPARQNIRLGRHPILDSKSVNQNPNKATPDSFRDADGNVDQSKLPKNERGEVELYKTRGTKEDRLARAAATHAKIMEHYENDPTYVP